MSKKKANKKEFMRGHNVGWYGSIAMGRHLQLSHNLRGKNLVEVEGISVLPSFWDRRLLRKIDRTLQKAHARGLVVYEC